MAKPPRTDKSRHAFSVHFREGLTRCRKHRNYIDNYRRKTTSAEIFTDNIEQSALDWVTDYATIRQWRACLSCKCLRCPCRQLMPMGTAYPIGMYVNPDHIGVDIGFTLSRCVFRVPPTPTTFRCSTTVFARAIPTGTEICPKNSSMRKNCFAF